MKKLYALFLPLILFVGLLASCGGGGETKYRVNFMVDEAVYYTVETNGKEEITLPTEPTKQYYDFSGWYLDNNVWQKEVRSNTFVDNPISSDTFVYAKWVSNTQADLSLSIDGFEKTNTTFSATVANSVQSINLSNKAHVATSSTWVVATDAQARNVIQNKTITLATGNNTYYVKVTAFDNTSRIYTLNIYRKAMFTVNFDANGGTPVTSQSVEEGTVITAPRTTREGYTFLSWGYDFSTPVTQNLSLTATWQANTYEISFDPKGGTVDTTTQEVTYDGSYTLPTPTREGYNFLGWYNGNTKVEDGIYETAADIALDAHWEPIVYTVSYSLNGGSLDEDNPTSYTIEGSTITLNNPTREGYNFLGWSGTGISGMSKNVVIPEHSTGNRSYTANWEAINYSISYDLNGGSLAVQNRTEYTADTPTFNLNNPYKNGYSFVGWTGTGLNDPTLIVTIPSGSTGSRSYTAHFELDTYVISYVLNGGTVEGENPTSYTYLSDSFTLTNPTREDYIFLGWTGTLLDGLTSEVTISKGSTGNRSYTANWKYDGYTINYHLNGGTNSPDNPINFKDTFDDIYLEDPSRTGYIFDGWYDNANFDGSQIDVIPTGTNHDVDLYAKWNPITYTVVFDSYGGEGSMDSMTFTYDVSQNLLPNQFTKEGYDFLGWTDYVSTYSAKYADQASVKNLTSVDGGTKVLYAVWRGIECTITFDNGAGSGVTSRTAHYNDFLPIISAPTAPYGYEFIGYFDIYGVQYYDGNATRLKRYDKLTDSTLYARYTAITNTISFDNGEGSGSSYTEATYGQNMPIASAPTAPYGYYFIGYYDDEGVKYYNSDMTSARSWDQVTNITLYARYYPITSNVYFSPYPGASVQGPYQATYGEDMPNISVSTTRTGYTFTGYFDTYGTKYYDENLQAVRKWNYGSDLVYLYGGWEGKEYTVTLDYNDGSGRTETVTAVMGEPMPSAAIPTRDEYIFVNFHDANDNNYYNSNMQSVRNYDYAGNTTLYASWELNEYTVYFNLNGGTGDQSWITVHVGEALPTLTVTPFKTGYTFKGYKDNYGKKYYNADLTPAVDAWDKPFDYTLDAIWEGLSFEVTLDQGEGSGGTEKVTAIYGNYLPSATAPSRDGYDFVGYYDEDGNRYYSYNMSVTRTWDHLEDTTLYARYQAKEFTIVLDHQGGTSSVYAVTATYNEEMPWTYEPTREGYVFLGYFDENGIQYYDDDMNSTKVYTELTAITLYAHWDLGTFTIYFEMDGGTPAQVLKEVVFTQELPELDAIPTKENYTFAGYFDMDDVLYYDEELNPVKTWDKGYNATLYAHYNGNPFTVTLDNTEGEGGTESVTAHFGEEMPDATAPSRIGYTFLGYFSENDVQYYDGEMNSVNNWDIGEDTTLYAHYELTPYYVSLSKSGESLPARVTLSFDLCGAEGSIPSQEITTTHGMVYPDIPTREGYIFAGWYKTNEYNEIFDFAGPISEDTTVYAKWLVVPLGSIAVSLGENTINIVGGSNTTYYAFVPLRTGSITINVGKNAWIGISETQSYSGKSSGYSTFSGNVTAGHLYYVFLQSYYGHTGSSYEGITYLNFAGAIYPSDGGVIGNDGSFLTGIAYYNQPFEFEVPTRFGYDFLGWFASEEDGGTQYTNELGEGLFNYDKLEDYILYAHWEAHTATVTFDHGEGESDITTIQVTFGEELPELAAPSLDYFDFLGYFDDQDKQYYDENMEPVREWDKDADATLYAHYSPKSYTVTLDPVEGETEDTSVEATYTQDMPVASAPTYFGHVFIGYFDENGVQYYDEAMVSMRVWDKPYDTTLYAHYEIGTYDVILMGADGEFTVSFDLMGGNGDIPAQVVSNEHPLTYPTNPTKDGYLFDGWYLDEEYENQYYFRGDIYRDFTLYAKYIPLTIENYSSSPWTVSGSSFNSTNHGSGSSSSYSISAPYDVTVSFSYRVSSESGYDYFTCYNGGSQVFRISGSSSNSTTISLSAGNYLTFTYSKDGSVDQGSDAAFVTNFVVRSNYHYDPDTTIAAGLAQLTYGEVSNISIIPSKLGCNFLGWYDGVDGTGTQYTDAEGNGLRNWDKENATLYPKWEGATYTITFDNGEGIGEVTTVEIQYGDELPEFAAPTRQYFDFLGYFDSEDNQYYDENMQGLRVWDKENATLYAHYAPKSYTVTLDAGEGESEDDSVIATYTEDMPVTSAPTLFGHEFIGYFDSEGVQYYDEAMVSVRAWDKPYDATLYAHYEAGTYTVMLEEASGGVDSATITYELNGGNSDITTQLVNRENPLVYPTNPTKAGYVFAGWYLDVELENLYDFTGVIDHDFTLYAKYLELSVDYNSWSVSGTSMNSLNKANNSISYYNITVPVATLFTFNYSVSSETNYDWFKCTNAGTTVFNISGSQSGYTSIVVNAGNILHFQYSKDGSQSSGSDAGYVSNLVIRSNISYDVTAHLPEVPDPTPIQLTYGEPTNISYVPTLEGCSFLGWYDGEGGTGYQYTDAEGNSLRNWDKEEATLYARWSGNSFTMFFETNGGTSIEPIVFRYGDEIVLPLENPTKEGKSFAGWYDETLENEFNLETMPARDVTLYAKWDEYSISTHYDDVDGIGVNAPITADLFNLQVVDSDGNEFEGNYEIVSGTKEAGQTISIRFYGVGLYETAWEVIIPDVRVYGTPTLYYNGGVTSFSGSSELTGSHFGALASDTFGESLEVVVTVKEDSYSVGDFVTILLTTTDCCGNSKTVEVPNIEVCEPPVDIWDGSRASSFINGSGSISDPYLISTGSELALLAYNTNSGYDYSNKYFKLVNDIDLNNREWTPIGKANGVNDSTSGFNGVFDGDGHSIKNLAFAEATTMRTVGLFGRLRNGSVVKNLVLKSANISVTYTASDNQFYIGGFVGIANSASLSNLYIDGHLYSYQTNSKSVTFAGSIVGLAENHTVIQNVVARCDVENHIYNSGFNAYTGGICGEIVESTVNNCLYEGNVVSTSSSRMGYGASIVGIVEGSSYSATITNTISLGSVTVDSDGIYSGVYLPWSGSYATLEHNYHNITGSGGTLSNYGSLIYTEQLTDQEWLEANLGWDFENTWTMKDSMPTLRIAA